MQEIKLGQMIRERMEARNMSLAEFARAIGRSSSTALEIFDKDSIKLEQIEEISKALDFNFLQVRADRLAHSIGKNQYLQETDEYSNIKFTYDEYGIRHADRIQLNTLIDSYRQQRTAFAKPLLLLEVGYTFGAREVVEKVYTSVFDGPRHETYSPETLEQLNRDIVLIDYNITKDLFLRLNHLLTKKSNNMKILGTLNINGNQEEFQLTLPDDLASKTLTLFEEAHKTILQDIEEEEQSKVFDEWLKSKDTSLYKSLMSEFMSELHLRLQEGSVFDDGNCCSLDGVLPPVGVDDNYWWPENQNTIEIESFKQLKK